MTALSVIVPERNGGEVVAGMLAPLCAVLDRRGEAYEIICVDDGSGAQELSHLQTALAPYRAVRLLRLDRTAGTAAALSAGIAAARGETVVAVEAGGQYSMEDIPRLLGRLARADLVAGRRRRGRLYKFWQRLAQLPRRLLLGSDARDPDCLFWAARREAVAGLELPRGMHRYLPTLVSLRGFRVAEVYIDHRPAASPRRHDGWPNPGDLLAAWWWRRRWRPFTAVELSGTLARQARVDGPEHIWQTNRPHCLLSDAATDGPRQPSVHEAEQREP